MYTPGSSPNQTLSKNQRHETVDHPKVALSPLRDKSKNQLSFQSNCFDRCFANRFPIGLGILTQCFFRPIAI